MLLLDYDGTLAPFHADKMQAMPYPGVADLLQALYKTDRVRLIFVTGRRASDLPHLIDLARHVEIWGSHGREHITADGQYTLSPVTREQQTLLDDIAEDVSRTLSGIHLSPEPGSGDELQPPLERKPGSLAVHWRGLNATSRATVQDTAINAFNRHQSPVVQQLSFASGVEFRATGYTKAIAVQQALDQTAHGNVVAYLGDDLTDEDAFVALGQSGLSLLVGAQSRPTYAEFWLRPPADLLSFFKDWLHALQEPHQDHQP